jgi:hypothetical protein
VGPYTSISSRLLGDLVLGDRDFLVLEVRRISMGDIINVTIECGACHAKVDVKFNIDEIEVIKLEKMEDYPERDGNITFKINKPKFTAICRFPKGSDQELIMPGAKKNPVAATYGLYTACLLEWNDKKGPFDSTYFDSLPINIIDEFEEEFMNIQPGPVMKQDATCPACNGSIDFSFKGSDFLFRVPKRGKM